MTKNTFQSVDVSISEKSILTKHDLINEENYFLIRKQDLNMQSLSTGIYMFSIALAFFFYI